MADPDPKEVARIDSLLTKWGVGAGFEEGRRRRRAVAVLLASSHPGQITDALIDRLNAEAKLQGVRNFGRWLVDLFESKEWEDYLEGLDSRLRRGEVNQTPGALERQRNLEAAAFGMTPAQHRRYLWERHILYAVAHGDGLGEVPAEEREAEGFDFLAWLAKHNNISRDDLLGIVYRLALKELDRTPQSLLQRWERKQKAKA